MQLDDETLQRYYDGDLSPVEERVVRTRIESDPDAQKRLRELEKLSALMRIGAEEMASGLDSDALFARIEQGIEKHESVGLGERLRVISGEWLSHRRQVVLPMMAAAAAAAIAVVTLTARDAGDEDLARSAAKRERVRLAQVEAPATKVQGSRVENVDFGTNTGTVFEIESAGVMTAVVWIADEEEEGP
jgi:hypothetical protein